jgi:hypothetical protein
MESPLVEPLAAWRVVVKSAVDPQAVGSESPVQERSRKGGASAEG